MSPVKNRAISKPIPVEARPSLGSTSRVSRQVTSILFGLIIDIPFSTYPTLPQNLASDIQLFSESNYAKQYFSTHRTGFIFRRKVPVAQMMVWQKVRVPFSTSNRYIHDLVTLPF
jgi:hypothetical protein